MISLVTGVLDFSFIDIFTGTEEDSITLFVSRVPRTISVVLTGAGLAVAGSIMQTITGNKFVSPTTAGTMDWCRLGIVIAVCFMGTQSMLTKTIFAFVVSLIGTLIFMYVLNKLKFQNNMIVPLIGMMLGNVVSAVSTFVAYKFDVIQNISSWLQGNFSLIIKGRYELLYVGIPCFFITIIYANRFTVIGIGEDFAKNLGENYKKVSFIGLCLVAFLTSLITVTIGTISFVGLVIPNIISMIKGDNLKNSLLDTALLGATFLLLCDIIGRSIIAPYEVTVSVVSSILGSFIFIILIGMNKR